MVAHCLCASIRLRQLCRFDRVKSSGPW
jgi:hypothetical protein